MGRGRRGAGERKCPPDRKKKRRKKRGSLCVSTSEPKTYLVNWLLEVGDLNNAQPLRGLNNMNKV